MAKVGRPKKNRDDIVKFQRVSMHIETYKMIKDYCVTHNLKMSDVLDDMVMSILYKK